MIAMVSDKPITSIQTTQVNEYDNELQQNRSSFNDYRDMRLDPTIALARQLAIAPILSSDWGYESEDDADDQREFIKWQMSALRRDFMRLTLLGQVDFGWKAFEKVFATLRHPEHGMRITIGKIKALQNDNTWALYGVQSGSFMGLKQTDLYTQSSVYIDPEHALFLNFDDEGVNDYASPLMAPAKQPYDEWLETNAAANRYDTKVAGSHWVVYYPVGKSRYNGEDGVDNSVIAAGVLSSLKSSGSVKVPVRVQSLVDEANSRETGWKIELVSDAGKSSDFLTRLKYLDSLKIRAMLITERSMVEGTFGTKAEAESHFNAAMMIMQLRHEMLTEHTNRYVVNQLLRLNYGVEDTVRLVAQPLVDERTALFKELFVMLTTNTATSTEILDSLNLEEILDSLKIPHSEIEEPEIVVVQAEPDTELEPEPDSELEPTPA